jgi:hypothetical protein
MANKKKISTPISSDGPYTLTEEHTDVIEYFDKICFLFDFQNTSNIPIVNITKVDKYYDQLVSGYCLDVGQKRIIDNLVFFCSHYKKAEQKEAKELLVSCEEFEKEEKEKDGKCIVEFHQ